jgi:hypothetical protein
MGNIKIPDELHQKFKVVATIRKIKLHAATEAAIEAWLKKNPSNV